MRRRRKFLAFACALCAALAVGAAPAAADPSANNPNVLVFNTVCPGMDPFQATVVGPIGFGDRFLAIRQSTATQGSLNIVECTATHPVLGTQTVFLTFIERG